MHVRHKINVEPQDPKKGGVRAMTTTADSNYDNCVRSASLAAVHPQMSTMLHSESKPSRSLHILLDQILGMSMGT